MTKREVKREMVKIRNLFLACAFVVLGLTLAGCPGKEAEQEKASEPALEAPATEMPAATEEMPMVPAESEEEAETETPEAEERK